MTGRELKCNVLDEEVNRMARILMISTHGYFEGKPSFGRADTGGQIVFVIELSKALAKLGYKVDILSRKFEDFNQIE